MSSDVSCIFSSVVKKKENALDTKSCLSETLSNSPSLFVIIHSFTNFVYIHHRVSSHSCRKMLNTPKSKTSAVCRGFTPFGCSTFMAKLHTVNMPPIRLLDVSNLHRMLFLRGSIFAGIKYGALPMRCPPKTHKGIWNTFKRYVSVVLLVPVRRIGYTNIK